MNAGDKPILRFIGGEDKKFIIPVYQRPYSWKKDNCVQLMKDLTDVYKKHYKSHFFGSVVYVSENDGSCEKYIIIDGQQRITTVSILLLAIRNYLLEHPNFNVSGINPDKIKDAYLTDPYSEDSKKLKLNLVQKDDEAYEALIVGLSPVENTSITANYNYFYREISKLSETELEGLYKAISNLIVVTISLKPENGDDPQLIFESLNSTGLDLEASDKIRNYVLMSMTSSKQGLFYKQYWEPLEKTVTRDEMNKFVRYYLAVKTRKLYDEKKLYFEFKCYHENSTKSIETILQDMLEYADYYNIICNPNKKKQKYSPVLSRINRLEMKTCVPLIMDLFKAKTDGDISEEELCKSLEIIENYIVRREICDLPTNALNKVFVQLGADIDKDIEDSNITYYDAFCHEIMKRSGRSRFPNNHDLEDRFEVYDLYNAKSAMKKYILERLENYNNKELVDVERLVTDGTLTIEHIMPQTLTDDWKIALGSNWELTHSKYKDVIGNLTLTAYNSDYSNSPFLVKKNMPEKGFVFSKLSLNDYVKTCDKWSEDEILARTNILYKNALNIWWIPKDNVIETNNDEWFDWDEDFDITNKKISQITLLDSVINTHDVTDAFKKIHETLYELDPTTYHNGSFPWFSENEKDLRKAYEIGKNAYIETNKSSQEKLNTIKTIAELLHFDSHDIKYLVQSKTEKPIFDINDENTFNNIKVGKLAYELFKDLIEKRNISKEEIEQFKTKEYTKNLFNLTDYPILANSREDNKGNSKHVRYRKNPLTFDGKDIYITTQWFEGNRCDLISWYKKHL